MEHPQEGAWKRQLRWGGAAWAMLTGGSARCELSPVWAPQIGGSPGRPVLSILRPHSGSGEGMWGSISDVRQGLGLSVRELCQVLCLVHDEAVALPTVAPEGSLTVYPTQAPYAISSDEGAQLAAVGPGDSVGHLLLKRPLLYSLSCRLWHREQLLPSCFSWHCLRRPGPAWGCPGGRVCTAAARPGPRLPPAHMPLRVMGWSGLSCPSFGPPSISQSSKVSVTERWPHPVPCPHRDTHPH